MKQRVKGSTMELRLILYVSQAILGGVNGKIPVDLAKISHNSRKNNREHQISGIFTFYAGHYLQVIEGDPHAIQNLYRNIQNDSRHQQVKTIIDIKTPKRYFPDWNMRLSSSLNREISFRNFIAANSVHFNQLDQTSKGMLARFFNFASKGNLNTLDNKSVRLSGWPDLTRIKASPVAIELSAKLVKEKENYTDLVESGEFGTKQQIDTMLNAFHNMGLLIISETTGTKATYNIPKANNSLYMKMKNFLRAS